MPWLIADSCTVRSLPHRWRKVLIHQMFWLHFCVDMLSMFVYANGLIALMWLERPGRGGSHLICVSNCKMVNMSAVICWHSLHLLFTVRHGPAHDLLIYLFARLWKIMLLLDPQMCFFSLKYQIVYFNSNSNGYFYLSFCDLTVLLL